MRRWKDVATLVKPKSLNGKFVARCAADFPFALEMGDRVAFVPPQTGLPRWGTVASVSAMGDFEYEVMFEEITDEVEAHGLAGCHCLIEREKIDDELFEREPASWAGWSVVDEDGSRIGEVVRLVNNPGQSLLEVRRPDSPKPVYIPVVDEFIRHVAVEAAEVVVALPQGLLDL